MFHPLGPVVTVSGVLRGLRAVRALRTNPTVHKLLVRRESALRVACHPAPVRELRQRSERFVMHGTMIPTPVTQKVAVDVHGAEDVAYAALPITEGVPARPGTHVPDAKNPLSVCHQRGELVDRGRRVAGPAGHICQVVTAGQDNRVLSAVNLLPY